MCSYSLRAECIDWLEETRAILEQYGRETVAYPCGSGPQGLGEEISRLQDHNR